MKQLMLTEDDLSFGLQPTLDGRGLSSGQEPEGFRRLGVECTPFEDIPPSSLSLFDGVPWCFQWHGVLAWGVLSSTTDVD